MSNTDTELDAAVEHKLLEIAYVIDDLSGLLETLRGTLEVSRRDLGHQARRLREIAPPILPPGRGR